MTYGEKFILWFLTFLVVPGTIPVGLTALRFLCGRIGTWKFQKFIAYLSSNPKPHNRGEVRGEVNRTLARIYNDAIFMSIPFTVGLGYKLMFDEILVSALYIGITFILIILYTWFRYLTIKIDILLFSQRTQVEGYEPGVSIKFVDRIVLICAITIWVFGTIAFYSLSPLTK